MAEVSSNNPRLTRWAELRLWRTVRGRYVYEDVARSIRSGEIDFCKARGANNLGEVFEFFGFGWLAKRLYEAARIEMPVEVVE